jgi:ADP-ribose pyrophosphatase YjhB (NUDIX family)
MPVLLLAHGLSVVERRVLLVASRYASHPQPLWNLPGGRIEPGELAAETIVRETREETGLHAVAADLAYMSESYDGQTHVVAAIFLMNVAGPIAIPQLQQLQNAVAAQTGDHVAAAEWVAIDELAARITVEVIREPLVHYLRDGTRYFARHEAGITIRW